MSLHLSARLRPLMRLARRLLGALLLAWAPGAFAAEAVTVTDLAGREVTIPHGAERVILGEGRLLYTLAVLRPEDPFAPLVGWRDELRRFDGDVWARLRERFPRAERLATFGKAANGEFSLERALALEPDAIVFDLAAWPTLADGPALAVLEAAGIPVVFVDFLTEPDRHLAPSVRLLGRLFAAEARAEALLTLRRQSLAAVAARLPERRPRVLIETAAGLHPDCCRSVGDDNLGRVVRLAGGDNIAAERLPGVFGRLHPEWILAEDPEVIVMTGGAWQGLRETAVPMGYDTRAAEARAAMTRLIESREGWPELAAVRAGRVHALWHQFYNTPFQFVAVQRLAKWLHPEAMVDLDPEALWRRLHDDFLPWSAEGAFWASLREEAP
ncbi:ABC transporter substrate-binding protein [Bisbaumannia pacifica]|uniref:ABC transporter substrate-binding protein n=2 Tax=Bisbaumannia pacifica TaxID=77098 RepID=A0A510XG84_9GAMM|nr:ABC transporter substrate-binding protein [Halomonas pacifica]GEK47790.1 ABC transporter substrate-binding protein [Halomonas pacifica]